MIGSKQEFESILKEKLGEPITDKLDLYLTFIIEYRSDLIPENIYKENHHILPTCLWPGYKFEQQNLKYLRYEDHVKAHILLSEAYPIREFLYPLNFMINELEYKTDPKYKENLSSSYKEMWVRLKEDKEWYMKFCENRSLYMQYAMKPGNDHYQKMVRGVQEYWDNISDKDREMRCKLMQTYWDNKSTEEREAFCKTQKESKTEDVRFRTSSTMKKKWEDENFREKHHKAMSKIIHTEEYKDKQQKAQSKIWQDESYREKMKHRKTRSSHIIEVIHPDGTIEIVYGIYKLLKTYKLNRELFFEFVDTGKKVHTKSNCKNKVNTIGYKFNFIKRL